MSRGIEWHLTFESRFNFLHFYWILSSYSRNIPECSTKHNPNPEHEHSFITIHLIVMHFIMQIKEALHSVVVPESYIKVRFNIWSKIFCHQMWEFDIRWKPTFFSLPLWNFRPERQFMSKKVVIITAKSVIYRHNCLCIVQWEHSTWKHKYQKITQFFE